MQRRRQAKIIQRRRAQIQRHGAHLLECLARNLHAFLGQQPVVAAPTQRHLQFYFHQRQGLADFIVEFARELRAQGRAALEAAVEAAHMRMRPIVMTSMAFILGVLPLALANGAGSASQNAIGIGVIGGMLTATFLATFLIPMFFVVISDKLGRARPVSSAALPVNRLN